MKKNKKVVLVVPNFRWADGDANTMWHYIPYNLCLLAAMVKDIIDVTILDAYREDLKSTQFTDALSRLNPDIIGITVLMDQYADAGHHAAKLAKSIDPNLVVVMGGVYTTMNTDHVMQDPNVDYAVIGEGEYVFKKLIHHLKGEGPIPEKGIAYREDERIINKGHSDLILDLDQLPLPAYHLIDTAKYFYSADRKSVDSPRAFPFARITTSRGCPFKCIFCQVEAIMGRKFRPRSATNVLNEIQWLKKEYNISSLIFDDDNLYTDLNRAKAIFQGMIDRNLSMPWTSIAMPVFRLEENLLTLMHNSGCRFIDIAVESGTQRILKFITNKPVDFEHTQEMVKFAKGIGIYVAANFIIGFPGETWDEIRETIRVAQEMDTDYVKLFIAIPLPKTDLWDICEKEKCLKQDFSHQDIRWGRGQIETSDFSASDLTILRAYEWDRINFTDPHKRARTAQMMGITEEELLSIRRETLKSAICNLSS